MSKTTDLDSVIDEYVVGALDGAAAGEFLQSDRYGRATMLGLLSLAAVEIRRLHSELERSRPSAQFTAEAYAARGGEPPAGSAAAKVKCRHVFVVYDGAERCSKCGAVKKANGRPRKPDAAPAPAAEGGGSSS